MELSALTSNPSRRGILQTENCVSGYALSRYAKTVSADGEEEIINLIKTAIQQHVKEHEGHNMAQRSYDHPLHPDLTPDVLTSVLPPGTVSSRRESEVDFAHISPSL